MHQVIDNFLSESEYAIIKNITDSDNFPWFYIKNITEETVGNESAFVHTLVVKSQSNSIYARAIMSIFKKNINIKETFRAKVNLYTRTDNLRIHDYHFDYHFDHMDNKIAIFYLNNNNGYTELKDTAKIESKKNRLLLFDGNVEHRSTNCTDEKTRVNININYTENK